tara:strand:+ start:18859 stop:19899 length:1041 start_codon:yes stop_codon:yes gene_type:complete
MHNNFDLNDLSNPNNFCDPLVFSDKESKIYLSHLKSLLKIRLVEDKIAYHKKIGDIGGPVHLGAGQEAIAVGISQNLKKGDKVFGAHRSHAHILSLGSDIRRLFSEILGKKTGLSNGMGGSMHLQDLEKGFYGSVPIVSGTIPIAVGSALASKLKSEKNVSISYFGDGAVEEGVFHESLNLAKILDCPIIFVCENNLFSSHMHISKRQPFSSQSRFAISNGIPHRTIDGNNIKECIKTASELIEISRNECVPTFIEAVTFRLYGHVDWREDIDVGVNRSKKDLDLWKKRDPIQRVKYGLMQAEILNEEEYQKIHNSIKIEIDNLWTLAIKDDYPDFKESNNYIYYE